MFDLNNGLQWEALDWKLKIPKASLCRITILLKSYMASWMVLNVWLSKEFLMVNKRTLFLFSSIAISCMLFPVRLFINFNRKIFNWFRMEELLTIELDFCLSKTKLEAIDKIVIREEFIYSIIHYLSKIFK